MTTYEYIEYILQVKYLEKSEDGITPSDATWENIALEAAQLICGSFIYRFYETLWLNDNPMEAITSHLEAMYDKSDFYGFIYFLILLADSIDFTFPPQFYEMSVQDTKTKRCGKVPLVFIYIYLLYERNKHEHGRIGYTRK